MKSPHQTIILTVVGHRPPLPTRLGGKRCAGLSDALDDGVSRARRAVLKVRPGEDVAGLKRRLTDSIVRLAGGVATDAGVICNQIISELQRAPLAGGGRRGWTLAPIQDGACDDPYAPRLTRLTLVESPVRRRRVSFMRQRPAFAGYKPHTQPRKRTHLVCLS